MTAVNYFECLIFKYKLQSCCNPYLCWKFESKLFVCVLLLHSLTDERIWVFGTQMTWLKTSDSFHPDNIFYQDNFEASDNRYF